MADEWARFMEQSPYGIITYTVDVDKKRPARGRAGRRCSRAWPTSAEGKYFDVSSAGDGEQIAMRIDRHLLARSRRVNTVFASVSLPVSVNTEGTYLNQIYIGMFRPDRDATPALGRAT